MADAVRVLASNHRYALNPTSHAFQRMFEMTTMTLNCRCGCVQVRISAPAVTQFYCHCDDCQATSGGAFIPIALFPSNAVSVSGDTFTWTYKTLPRTRCSTCGTFLFGEPRGLGLRGVSGSLLPAGTFQASFHNQCQFALLPVRDELPHFKSVPPAFGGTDERVGW